jgi:hypothetical protein
MRLRTAFFTIGIVCLAAPAAALNFVPVGPPGSPSITALAVGNADYVLPLSLPPSLLYAATTSAGLSPSSSVYRSANGGNSWTNAGDALSGVATSLAVRQVFHMGVDAGSYDTTLFLGMSGQGVFRLDPGAALWVSSSAGLTSSDIRAIAVGGDGVVRPGNAGIVYAGTGSGLFASADGGTTWVRKTAGLPDSSVTQLATNPQAPSVVYAGTAQGLYKSADFGETWSFLDTAPGFILQVSALAVDPLAPSRVYVAGVKTLPCNPICPPIAFLPVVLRSLDEGATWLPVSGLPLGLTTALAATNTLPSRVFAGTQGNGVFESDDAGTTFFAASAGLGAASVSSLVIDRVAPSFVFAGTAHGVFCSPLGQVAATCTSDAVTLCLNGQRFRATVVWRSAGNSGNGQAHPITDNTGAFWFFDPTNLELVVKVLDGRSVNGKWWVFFGSLTNVEFTLTVTDTLTGQVRTYTNPPGQMASFADAGAF